MNNNKRLPLVLFPETRELLKHLSEQTNSRNQNNVTRTSAYLDFFHQHVDIQWSFLAHMVSRNGGYQMTDLKGTILPTVLDEDEIHETFHLLETANSWIFQDAYPQLLLWDYCQKQQVNAFDLLTHFSVSQYMIEKWKEYFLSSSLPPSFITTALIVNEQMMLTKRLLGMDASHFPILSSVKFFIQQKVGWTDIVFPKKNYWKTELYGTSVDHFLDVKSRITTGYTLYKTLFNHSGVLSPFLSFANSVPHTGSRVDYWPFHFSEQQTNKRIYSPKLLDAWEDRIQQPIPKQDWYTTVEKEAVQHLLDLFTSTKSGVYRSKLHKSAWKKKDWLVSFREEAD